MLILHYKRRRRRAYDEDPHVRGAGLIGAAAAYGMYLAALEASKDNFLDDIKKSADILKATRPTAVNLEWAVDRQLDEIKHSKSLENVILNVSIPA